MNRIKKGTLYNATTRTEFVLYARKRTASNEIEIDGRLHHYSLSFSNIFYSARAVLFYEIEGKVYLFCPDTEYITSKVVVDVTEEFEELKEVCEIWETEETLLDFFEFNVFELQELIITEEVKHEIVIKGDISVYELDHENDEDEEQSLEESVEDESEEEDDCYYEDPNEVFYEENKFIIVKQEDGSERFFTLFYEQANSYSRGGTHELTEPDEIAQFQRQKREIIIQVKGAFIEKRGAFYNVSAIKDENEKFLLAVSGSQGRGGRYLNEKDCSYQMKQSGNNNIFHEYRIINR